MKRIDKNKLELLGSDYKRGTSYYLDHETGIVYKRSVALLKTKKDIEVMDATLVELIDGDAVYEKGFGPVLSRDN